MANSLKLKRGRKGIRGVWSLKLKRGREFVEPASHECSCKLFSFSVNNEFNYLWGIGSEQLGGHIITCECVEA